MPLPYRWLTSLMTRYNGSNLLIDCGEGTQIAIKDKGWGYKQIDIICFTHFHADHISGLPGLLLAMGNSERTEPLTIIGPKGVEKVVNSLRIIAPELPFPIKFIEIRDREQVVEKNGYVITAFRVNHNMVCYGYTIDIRRTGRFDADRAKSADIPLCFWNRLQKGETITDGDRTFTPDMVLGPERKGVRVGYVTDTRPVETISDHVKGADLFICEGMYGEPEKAAKAKEYKHMTMYEAAKLAKAAGVSELWLTHFSPSLTYPGNYMKDVQKIFAKSIAAKDGQTVDIDFPEE